MNSSPEAFHDPNERNDMGVKQVSAHCPNCNRQTRAIGDRPNHGLHAVLTILTFGLWGIVWIIMSIKKASSGYRCQSCGTKVTATG
jgi:predicted RNA-binding Zn-ribbon protein involved in translation (DUF1610 family)